MKMKMFFAAVAVLFTVSIATSCGNKKAATSTEETTEQVQACDSTKKEECCKADSIACDSTKACCAEKAEVAE